MVLLKQHTMVLLRQTGIVISQFRPLTTTPLKDEVDELWDIEKGFLKAFCGELKGGPHEVAPMGNSNHITNTIILDFSVPGQVSAPGDAPPKVLCHD